MRSLSIDLLRALADGQAGCRETTCGTTAGVAIRSLAGACGVRPAQAARELRCLEDAQYVLIQGEQVLALRPFDFLDPGHIARAMGSRAQEAEITVADACESTNARLLAQDIDARPRLLITEEQTAGRGRRGRRWLSALGQALTFSLGMRFSAPLRQLSGLSLAAGVAVARALRAAGAAEITLKWPNDLMLRGAKLGGILIETRSARSSICAVIGIGINYTVRPEFGARLRRDVTSLASCLQPLPSRNELVGRIAAELLGALAEFRAKGLDAVHAEWEALHAHAGHRLRVRLSSGRVVTGLANGLDAQGGLVLRTRAGLTSVTSGHILSASLA